MSRHDHRGHLTGSALAAVSLLAFDVCDAREQLPFTIRLVVTQALLIATAVLLTTSAVRLVLTRWTARREAAETAAVQESYRLGWVAATTVAEEPRLRLVSEPHRR